MKSVGNTQTIIYANDKKFDLGRMLCNPSSGFDSMQEAAEPSGDMAAPQLTYADLQYTVSQIPERMLFLIVYKPPLSPAGIRLSFCEMIVN